MSLAPDEQYCSSCGEPVKKAAEWCPNCGVSNSPTTTTDTQSQVYCETCGKQIPANAEICPGCGVRQQPQTTTSTSDSPEFDFSDLPWDVRTIWHYTQWGIGIFFLIGTLGMLGDPEVGIVTTLIAGFIGLAFIPRVRETVSKEHPVTTFGTVQSIRTERVENPTELCAACYGDIERGVQKEFGKDTVVAGLVLSRNVEGTNRYCKECWKLEEGAIEIDDLKQDDKTTM